MRETKNTFRQSRSKVCECTVARRNIDYLQIYATRKTENPSHSAQSPYHYPPSVHPSAPTPTWTPCDTAARTFPALDRKRADKAFRNAVWVSIREHAHRHTPARACRARQPVLQVVRDGIRGGEGAGLSSGLNYPRTPGQGRSSFTRDKP